MLFQPQLIPEVVLITPKRYRDERGLFMETFRQDIFEQHCGDYQFVQANHSESSQGVLRGLHYQYQKPQGKLVHFSQGKVFDVCVDLRKNSPTFGQWVSVILSAENKNILWVPPGFAHGFYVLSANAVCHYKCTDYYHPDEYTLAWDDPSVNILWPLINQAPPLLSAKDSQGLALNQCPFFEHL